jgi:YD repeat-containing protein
LTVYRYDWRGLLSSVTLDGKTAQAQVWSYGYDEFGNLTRVTDPLAGVTQYQYDELGRRTLPETPVLWLERPWQQHRAKSPSNKSRRAIWFGRGTN